MTVSRLEDIGRTKYKVYIDSEYAFPLYYKDISRFQIEEGKELSYEVYTEILEDTILRRAKQKALAVLKLTDRTEAEIRNKLKDAGYPDNISDRVLDYVRGYGYINDERYAGYYVRTKMNNKSKIIIRMELLQKGIKKDIIDKVLSMEYECEDSENPEIKAIQKAVAKKCTDPSSLTREEKQKLMASLYRKGFEIDKINQVLRQEEY